METAELREILIETIRSDPGQPRKLDQTLDTLIEREQGGDRQAQAVWERLVALSTSILEVGLQEPITVYPGEVEGQYIILDGHRRWLAVSLLHRQGEGRIACYVCPKPEVNDLLLRQLNINLQREDLNVFELARSLQRIYEDLRAKGGTVRVVSEAGEVETLRLAPGATSKDVWQVIERKVGIGRPRRYQIQGVLKLPVRIQELAAGAGLPESRLRYLIPVQDETILETIIKEIVEQKLSNMAIKKRIKALQALPPPEVNDAANVVIEASPALVERSPRVAMPKPMKIKSAIKPIQALATDLQGVHNTLGAISKKDPRTVASYRALLPELRAAVKDLEMVLETLAVLDEADL